MAIDKKKTKPKSRRPVLDSIQSESGPSFGLFFKLSLLILTISFVGVYFVENPAEKLSFTSILDKCVDFVCETWSTFSLSTKVIYTKLLKSKSNLSVRFVNELLEEESKTKPRRDSNIAVGLGLCTDLVVEAADILNGIEPPKSSYPHDNIENWEQFLQLFAYYFQRGAASERYIKSKSIFNRLIELIEKLPANKKKKAIGGNAALMSLRFVQEGIERILLGAQISPELKGKFPRNIQISGPTISQDDYHIMLEYKTNERWDQYQSPRSNRLIVHSDDNNVRLLPRETFFQQLKQFHPDLLIITALHMLDMSPIEFRHRSHAIENLAKDIEQLHQDPTKNFRTHFEMGSFTENRLLDSIVNQIFPHMDSFGMNEQEVANLLSFIKFGNISYATNPFPRVAIVLDQMRELFSLLDLIGHSRVNRIHVHTLAYQVVMVKINAQTKMPFWLSSKSAMAKASLTAYRHTCNLSEIDLERTNILLDDSFSSSASSSNTKRIRLDSAIQCWEEDIQSKRVQICLAVGLVCTKVVQTGGAGDNISAAGIVLQI